LVVRLKWWYNTLGAEHCNNDFGGWGEHKSIRVHLHVQWPFADDNPDSFWVCTT